MHKFCYTMLLMSWLVGCGSATLAGQAKPTAASTVAPTPQPTPLPTPAATQPSATHQLPRHLPDLAVITPSAPGIVGQVPASIMATILEDAAARSGTARSTINELRGEATQFPNAALGCPQAGRAYANHVVNGYFVLLEANGERFDYRVAANGTFIVCTRPGAPQ